MIPHRISVAAIGEKIDVRHCEANTVLAQVDIGIGASDITMMVIRNCH